MIGKWSPGDQIVIDDHRSIHRGTVCRLVDRHIGRIAGRPWWTLRLPSGAIASEFEDSLQGADPTPHDGQANTSSIRWSDSLASIEAKLADLRARVNAPTMLDTATGCARWQLDDPAHRRMNLSLQSHTLDAWATVLGEGGPSTKHTKFITPKTSAEAHRTLDESFGLSCGDAAVVVSSNAEIVFIAEDTGSVD